MLPVHKNWKSKCIIRNTEYRQFIEYFVSFIPIYLLSRQHVRYVQYTSRYVTNIGHWCEKVQIKYKKPSCR